MTTEVATTNNAVMLERVVLGGDLSKLSAQERMLYYRELCASLKLNPLTQPFQYLNLSGRLVLYARKDATEQLRKQHGVSITKLEEITMEGVYIVTAYAKDKEGREDVAKGAVMIENLKGEARANAIMKAETKSKRRVTLSICGLGMLDETEVETIPGAQVVPIADTLREIAEGQQADIERDIAATENVVDEERDEKIAVLESIAKGYGFLKTSPQMQVVLWKKHTGGDVFMDPDSVTLDALNALLGELRALHAAKVSRERK